MYSMCIGDFIAQFMYELKIIKSYHINTVDLVTTIFKLKYVVPILISFSMKATLFDINFDVNLNICLKLIKIKISNRVSFFFTIDNWDIDTS